MIIIKNRNTTYLQDKYKLNEGFSTMATGLLSFWRCIGVIVSGFVCDFIGLKLQIVFFTFTMFLSMGSWAVIGIWEEVPLYGFLICISSYSLFVSPTYYLAGQFFSVIFGGAKHCGFLDGLKGNLFLKILDGVQASSGMVFSFVSGVLVEQGWVWLLNTVTALGLFTLIFVFLFQLLDYYVETYLIKKVKNVSGESKTLIN
jgi:hypothetical protein